eukprot:scaffold2036_cov51-Attheya_sp.AAC.5
MVSIVRGNDDRSDTSYGNDANLSQNSHRIADPIIRGKYRWSWQQRGDGVNGIAARPGDAIDESSTVV